jgi:hypothetical protein
MFPTEETSNRGTRFDNVQLVIGIAEFVWKII